MRKKTFAAAAMLAAATMTLTACGSGDDSGKPVAVVSEETSHQAATVLDQPFEKPDLVLTDTHGKKYDSGRRRRAGPR
jgi:protein SCO1/2